MMSVRLLEDEVVGGRMLRVGCVHRKQSEAAAKSRGGRYNKLILLVCYCRG